MIGLYIALIIIAVLGLIAIVPIKAKISFAANDENNEITLRYGFLRFKLYPKNSDKQNEEKPKKDKKDKEEKPKKKTDIKAVLKAAWEIRDDIKREISKIIYYVSCRAIAFEELSVSARIGLDDAMNTAIVSGYANAFAYGAIGLLDRFSKLKTWRASIEPDFETSKIQVGFFGIISTNIAHIITLLIKLIRSYMKINSKLTKIRKESVEDESDKRND